MKNLIKATLKWCYWHPFCWIVQKLPTTFTYWFVELISPLIISLSLVKRKKIHSGLKDIYDKSKTEREIEKIVYKTLEECYKNSLDHLLYPSFTPQFCNKKVSYVGLEHIEEGLKKKKGVVLLHGHLGNPHIIMPAIGSKGYQLNQLASRIPPETTTGMLSRITDYLRQRSYSRVIELRESFPVTFLYIDKYLRAPLHALERNEIVAIAMDGREGSKGVEIPFLNHSALFFTGGMRIIMSSEAVVLPCFHIRGPRDTHEIVITKPMNILRGGNRKEDIIVNISTFAKLLERQVHMNPHLYVDLFLVSDEFLQSYNLEMEPERSCETCIEGKKSAN